MPDLKVAELLSQLPIAVLLLLILITGYRGWWVYGVWHRDRLAQEIERRNEAVAAAAKWERLALEAHGLAHRATDIASTAVSSVQGGPR